MTRHLSIVLMMLSMFAAGCTGKGEMDLNLNHQIERFEKNFFKKKKEGEKKACVMILRKAVDERNLTEYQIDRATYALICKRTSMALGNFYRKEVKEDSRSKE